jgi:queuine tRNA-ribosyltransferase
MGVGTPANILEAVDRGVDFFDCVYPSRNGRHGQVYTNHGKLNLKNARFELDESPIDPDCDCPVCKRYTKSYIRHLLKRDEMLGLRFCTLHNLYFYNHLMEEIREAIDNDSWDSWKKKALDDLNEERQNHKVMNQPKFYQKVRNDAVASAPEKAQKPVRDSEEKK